MTILTFAKQLVKNFGEDKVGVWSAAFAYSAIFAIGPLLLMLISISGLIFGEAAAQGKLFEQLSDVLGTDAARTLQDVITSIHSSGGSTLALIIGTIGLLLGASAITSQLQNAFNSILSVVPDPKGGIKRTMYVKAKNISLVIVAGIFIGVSLVISTLVAGFGESLQREIGLPFATIEILNNLVSLTILAMLIYFIYRIIPDVRVPRKIVLCTALVVTLLFLIGKFVLGLIIANNGTASAYGAAATLISLILWIYYSGQILFVGAEGIKVYGEMNSLEYRPKKFNLKRTTVTLDGKAGNRFVEAWLRGYHKKSGGKAL